MTQDLHEIPTEYVISALPPEHRDFPRRAVTVRWRGVEQWSIAPNRSTGAEVFTAAGELVPDRRPDEEQPLAPITRFDLTTALSIARTLADQHHG